MSVHNAIVYLATVWGVQSTCQGVRSLFVLVQVYKWPVMSKYISYLYIWKYSAHNQGIGIGGIFSWNLKLCAQTDLFFTLWHQCKNCKRYFPTLSMSVFILSRIYPGLRFNSIKHESIQKTNGLILLSADLLGASYPTFRTSEAYFYPAYQVPDSAA